MFRNEESIETGYDEKIIFQHFRITYRLHRYQVYSTLIQFAITIEMHQRLHNALEITITKVVHYTRKYEVTAN